MVLAGRGHHHFRRRSRLRLRLRRLRRLHQSAESSAAIRHALPTRAATGAAISSVHASRTRALMCCSAETSRVRTIQDVCLGRTSPTCLESAGKTRFVLATPIGSIPGILHPKQLRHAAARYLAASYIGRCGVRQSELSAPPLDSIST